MKQLLSLLLSVLLLTACSSHRSVIAVPTVTHDTLVELQRQYDSIYIQQDHCVDLRHDTVYCHDKIVEYRYQWRHDTIRIVQVDSIPVIHQVPAKATHRTRIRTIIGFLGALSLLGFGCFLVILVGVGRRVAPLNPPKGGKT